MRANEVKQSGGESEGGGEGGIAAWPERGGLREALETLVSERSVVPWSVSDVDISFSRSERR